MNVLIEPSNNSSRPWKARIGLAKGYAWPYPVQGQASESGPWIEGYGISPEGALENAYASLGRAAFNMSHESGGGQ